MKFSNRLSWQGEDGLGRDPKPYPISAHLSTYLRGKGLLTPLSEANKTQAVRLVHSSPPPACSMQSSLQGKLFCCAISLNSDYISSHKQLLFFFSENQVKHYFIQHSRMIRSQLSGNSAFRFLYLISSPSKKLPSISLPCRLTKIYFQFAIQPS